MSLLSFRFFSSQYVLCVCVRAAAGEPGVGTLWKLVCQFSQ